MALRKLGRLLEEGAKVVLVAPELVPELQELMESLPEESLVWHQMTHRDFDWEASDFRLYLRLQIVERQIMRLARWLMVMGPW